MKLKQILILITLTIFIISSINIVQCAVYTNVYDYGTYSYYGYVPDPLYYTWKNATKDATITMYMRWTEQHQSGTGYYHLYIPQVGIETITRGGGTCGCSGEQCLDCDEIVFSFFSNTGEITLDEQAYMDIDHGAVTGCSGNSCGPIEDVNRFCVIVFSETGSYTLSGNTGCVNNISIYIDQGGSEYCIYEEDLNPSGDNYECPISYNFDYIIKIDGIIVHTFLCDGNEIYNYNLCDYYKINLLDNCANPLINPHTTIFRNMTEIIYEGSNNPIELNIGYDVEIADYVQIIIDTKDGAVQYNDYVTVIEQDLYHPTISWNLNIHVVDDNTDADISQAKVTRTQDCCIVGTPSGYALTQTNGHVIFTGLANSNIDLTVEKSGYNTYNGVMSVGNTFNCWSNGGSVTVSMNATTGNSTDDFNNGTNETDSYDGEGNNTLIDDHQWGCGVYFKNTEGVITDTINDTDAYVDMYYWIKGCNVTLKFQSQIYTYWYTDVEYQVLNNSGEYRRILNTNFSDYTNSYRGYIYNSSCDCNDIQNLYVINQTYEEETEYENLTSHCWIKNKLSGNQIDYRSDIKCVIYANSTNSTLLDITANFMNGTTLVDSKVLNWADFVSGSPKWYYTWYLDYDYTAGYNYTLNITGFDGYQLDTDEVWTADIIGNELTVFVKDNYNQQIPYATIFIEDWGSIATGTHNYATVTGLPDGDYQYKATKSGYISSGWATITLTEHESVTCILIALEETSVIGKKMSDEDIKSMFIPMMYILFIFMILGAFMYANR